MFTGLVEEVGRVSAMEPQGDAMRLSLTGPLVTSDAELGASIAVNGVCLTVATLDGDTFTADVMQESLNRTALGELTVGAPVNLERALLPTTRLGGHIMQGHVDGTARLLSRTPSEHWEVLRFGLPRELERYVVEKGSIAVSGTSLTVATISQPGASELDLRTGPARAGGGHRGAAPGFGSLTRGRDGRRPGRGGAGRALWSLVHRRARSRRGTVRVSPRR